MPPVVASYISFQPSPSKIYFLSYIHVYTQGFTIPILEDVTRMQKISLLSSIQRHGANSGINIDHKRLQLRHQSSRTRTAREATGCVSLDTHSFVSSSTTSKVVDNRPSFIGFFLDIKILNRGNHFLQRYNPVR